MRHRWRASAALAERAKEFRQPLTEAEGVLWERLRNRALGVKFRRQHPIGGYIADFCCVERRQIVELDGPVHLRQMAQDARRTANLEAMGYRVLRWTNEQVLNDVDRVIEELKRELDEAG